MQESRLFKIVYYLLDKGKATAPELAEKFEVSVRTIYRDIDALSGAGIPIYTEAGRNGGIHLMNNFVLDRSLLSEEEKTEILDALQGLSTIQNMKNNDTLNKLSALWGISSENWLEVDFSRWGNKQSDNEKFELLKSAIIHHKSVKITYAGSSESVSERIIHPLKLVYKSRDWYLKAYCTEKQDYRLFKLTRILEWEILNISFIHHSFPKQEENSQQIYNQITLRFPKEMAYRVYDEFDRTEVCRQENGDFIVSVQMPEDMWLISFLLSFGTQVEVIEPDYLKDILAQQARLIYEKNKS
ncbi:MAG: YafY family transcriptional regulator [Lachnospiraceae bacterium]|nr:YafY family transcriptional regulator [Lachnospiraceae bacterium]